MSILARFNDIVKANVNVLLDKMEDPSKMIDQYLRDMMEDLAEVKKETAGVMAEESRTRRMVEETAAEVEKYTNLAKKALAAGSEEDARVFIEKKQKLEGVAESAKQSHEAAALNAEKMREMHDMIDMLTAWYTDMQKMDNDRLVHLLKLGAKVYKLYEMKDKLTLIPGGKSKKNSKAQEE